MKEIILEHKDIKNSQTITEVMDKKFKEKGLNLHVNEVKSLEDDMKKGIRKIEVINTKYFTVPPLPWKDYNEKMS